MKAGKLPEDFLEGMICTGGCVSGPGVIKTSVQAAADRNRSVALADERTIGDSIAAHGDLEFSMHRSEETEG